MMENRRNCGFGMAFCIAAALGLSACAGNGGYGEDKAVTRQQAEETPERTDTIPSGTGECIYVRNIRNWEAVNRRALIVQAPTDKRAYLVQLVRPCFDLPFAETIGFDGGMDERLCEYGGDAVVVGRERCPIASIRPIAGETESDDMNELEPAKDAE